jgi:hypothetical protein
MGISRRSAQPLALVLCWPLLAAFAGLALGESSRNFLHLCTSYLTWALPNGDPPSSPPPFPPTLTPSPSFQTLAGIERFLARRLSRETAGKASPRATEQIGMNYCRSLIFLPAFFIFFPPAASAFLLLYCGSDFFPANIFAIFGASPCWDFYPSPTSLTLTSFILSNSRDPQSHQHDPGPRSPLLGDLRLPALPPTRLCAPLLRRHMLDEASVVCALQRRLQVRALPLSLCV